MKYLITPIIGLLLAIVALVVAPVAMLVVVWFIRWDGTPSNGSYNQNPAIRGDLPSCLKWFQTPDERFPGGLYEPAIQGLYDTYGKYVCSYVWAGLRNQMMGLAAWLGKETTDYLPEFPLGFYEQDGGNVWRYSTHIGLIRFVCGWQVYRKADMTFLAVPVCTIKSS
jgi:hypothetical protein